MNELDKLKEILKFADRELIKMSDVQAIVKFFAGIVKELKVIIETNISQTKDDISKSILDSERVIFSLEKQIDNILKGMEETSIDKRRIDELYRITTKLYSEIENVRSLIPNVPDLMYLEEKIKLLEEVTPNEIIQKINKGDDFIDKERIGGLADELKKIREISSVRPERVIGGPNGMFLYVNNVNKGLIKTLNVTAGSGVTITHDYASGLNTLTISATGYQAPISGALGQGTFVFTNAPNVLVVDGVTIRKTQSDGTVNWTGTTTITLSNVIANFDIFALG